MQALLDQIIADPARCESIASGKELFEIAKNLLGLKVTKSMSKGDLCKAVKRAVQGAPVQSTHVHNVPVHNAPVHNAPHNTYELEEKREIEEKVAPMTFAIPKQVHSQSLYKSEQKREEKREIEEKVAPMTTAIRKQVLGQDLYDMCLERGGRVERSQLTWRLKQLQEEGLFEGCSEDDLVRVCDFRKEPSSGCAKHMFEQDKYTDFNTCAICIDVEDEEGMLPIRTPCGHMMHASCLSKTEQPLRGTLPYLIPTCPFCRKGIRMEKQGNKWKLYPYDIEARKRFLQRQYI